jgi:hypothetical protein
VRGFGRFRRSSVERRNDLFKDAINILGHIVVPETQNKITHCRKYLGSLNISIPANSVLSAIELNDQARIRTEEIDDEAVDRNLPPKFPAGEPPVTQTKPKDALGGCLIPPQASCGLGACLGRPNPLTPTLSPLGRGSALAQASSFVISPHAHDATLTGSFFVVLIAAFSGRTPSRWQTA